VRVGGIILALMIVLWFLSSFPAPPADATGRPIYYSLAGMLGRALEVRVRADRLQLADLDRTGAGLAAREVAVGALGTVYAMSGTADLAGPRSAPVIAAELEPRHRAVAAGLVSCSRRSVCRRSRS
jgi:ferrous iron transport protein B